MTESSFAPRFTTMLILIGASPAAAAASMPFSTSETGKSASFILRNTASSSESRLTVTRLRPAALRARFFREDRAVGGEREVKPRNVGEHLDQALEVPAQQRLAAGQADFLDPVTLEHARQPRDLLEAQQFALREKRVVGAEHVARHAVDAPEVAAVGDRDAQVVQPATERVLAGARGRAQFPFRGEGFCPACVRDRYDPVGHGLRSRLMKCSS